MKEWVVAILLIGIMFLFCDSLSRAEVKIVRLQTQMNALQPFLDHMITDYKRLDTNVNLITDNDYTEYKLNERQVKALIQREKQNRNPLGSNLPYTMED